MQLLGTNNIIKAAWALVHHALFNPLEQVFKGSALKGKYPTREVLLVAVNHICAVVYRAVICDENGERFCDAEILFYGQNLEEDKKIFDFIDQLQQQKRRTIFLLSSGAGYLFDVYFQGKGYNVVGYSSLSAACHNSKDRALYCDKKSKGHWLLMDAIESSQLKISVKIQGISAERRLAIKNTLYRQLEYRGFSELGGRIKFISNSDAKMSILLRDALAMLYIQKT